MKLNIRTSHNPPAPALLELCDRMGFVVIAETFDNWYGRYGKWFADWWQADLTDMLRRDRNHPSVVMWSVGNEVSGQGSSVFMEQLQELVEWTRRIDPTRPVTCALRPRGRRVDARDENARNVARIARMVDVISCNYQEQWFEDYRQAYPEIIILASESFVYYRGHENDLVTYKGTNPWRDTVKHDYVAGTFYWTGIDYLGEVADRDWPFPGCAGGATG